VTITTAYPTGAHIEVGQSGNLSSFQTIAQNTPQTLGTYSQAQYTPTVNSPIIATVNGPWPNGAGYVTVQYAIPLD
jgi:hypothetical protein